MADPDAGSKNMNAKAKQTAGGGAHAFAVENPRVLLKHRKRWAVPALRRHPAWRLLFCVRSRTARIKNIFYLCASASLRQIS
jgi:hypothetical protein